MVITYVRFTDPVKMIGDLFWTLDTMTNCRLVLIKLQQWQNFGKQANMCEIKTVNSIGGGSVAGTCQESSKILSLPSEGANVKRNYASNMWPAQKCHFKYGLGSFILSPWQWARRRLIRRKIDTGVTCVGKIWAGLTCGQCGGLGPTENPPAVGRSSEQWAPTCQLLFWLLPSSCLATMWFTYKYMSTYLSTSDYLMSSSIKDWTTLAHTPTYHIVTLTSALCLNNCLMSGSNPPRIWASTWVF